MPVVATGVLSSPIPGLWRRLGLISDDGSIGGLTDESLVGQLEELGIPRHQHGLALLLLSWQRARIPPDVAFALWLLRDRVDGDGCIYRRASMPVEESSPAIRYTQLAASVGETRESDPTLRRVVRWLLDRQLPDGSMPLIISTGRGETGQTARTLKAVGLLRDPELTERLDAMRDYLCRTAIPQRSGVAWSYSAADQTAVTGSTSLASTALLRYGGCDTVVRAGLTFLLAVQEADGGWSEVPGHQPQIHNLFNAVRAIRTATRAGILHPDEAAEALDRGRAWLLREVRGRPPRPVLDHAFAVRATTELDLLAAPGVEKLAQQLTRRRNQFLDMAADSYTETAIAAIALVEVSRTLDATSGRDAWPWRWRLPTLPPPFLATGAYFYELLYGVVRSRRWVKIVDRIMASAVVDRSAGILLGTITALGIVDPDVGDVLVRADTLRTTLTIAGVSALLLLWLSVKAAARSSLIRAVTSSAGALATAGLLTWILHTPIPPLPALLSLIGLRMLVIDVVAFAADSTGLLDRLLPKN